MSSCSEDGSTVSMTSANSACSSGRYGSLRTHTVHRRSTRAELRRRSGRYSAMRSASAAGSPGSAINNTETCSPPAPERDPCRCSFADTVFAYPLGTPANSMQSHAHCRAARRRLSPDELASFRDSRSPSTTLGTGRPSVRRPDEKRTEGRPMPWRRITQHSPNTDRDGSTRTDPQAGTRTSVRGAAPAPTPRHVADSYYLCASD